MAAERYVLTAAGGEYVLPGSFRPSQLSPTARTPNLVRARGHRRVIDLSDGLPDPAPLVLTGTLRARTEDELALALRELRAAARACTLLSRNDRPGVEIVGASTLAVPVGDNSAECQVTLTLIPAAVPDEQSGIYDW